jgi:hypothetical protein
MFSRSATPVLVSTIWPRDVPTAFKVPGSRMGAYGATAGSGRVDDPRVLTDSYFGDQGQARRAGSSVNCRYVRSTP